LGSLFSANHAVIGELILRTTGLSTHRPETIEEIETSVRLLKAVPDQWKPDASASGNFALLLYAFIEDGRTSPT